MTPHYSGIYIDGRLLFNFNFWWTKLHFDHNYLYLKVAGRHAESTGNFCSKGQKAESPIGRRGTHVLVTHKSTFCANASSLGLLTLLLLHKQCVNFYYCTTLNFPKWITVLYKKILLYPNPLPIHHLCVHAYVLILVFALLALKQNKETLSCWPCFQCGRYVFWCCKLVP